MRRAWGSVREVGADKALLTSVPLLRTSVIVREPIAFTSKVTGREYSTLNFKRTTILGNTVWAVPPTSKLTSSHGRRTLITTAHEDDRVITHVSPKKAAVPERKAIVLNGSKLKPNRQLETNTMVVISAHDEPEFVSTTNKELHEYMKSLRRMNVGQMLERAAVISGVENVVGGIRIDSFGPYFGGNPTVLLPRTLEEQIYPDATFFTTSGIDAYRAIREETAQHGPRISGLKELLLVKDKDGKYKTTSLGDRAFVNSTVHRGMQKGPDGLYHPTTCYTPGSALVSHAKSRVAERHDGSTLQTVSVATNASADILCHWLLQGVRQILGPKADDLSGLKRLYTDKGVIESLIVHKGVGQRIAHFALLATGTPFDMTTLTIHRDKEGNPLHFMAHKRTKPWPANESLVEITGPKGERQFVIYDSLIPQASFWRDLTVGKLTTPIMNESVIMGSIQSGKLAAITDEELREDMVSQNTKGRYTYGELVHEDVPISMLMSAAGLNKTDTRSRVTEVSLTGEFDHAKIIKQHIAQDPGTMEYYFCGRAARILTENIERAFEGNYALWEENASVRNLWHLATSAIPTYENMEKYAKEYATVINEVMKDPSERRRMDECLNWAKEAHDAQLQQARTLAH